MAYIPTDIIQALQSNAFIIDEHIQTHFETICQLQRIIVSKKQAAFMICRHNHWFTVAFDWREDTAWIFNRSPLQSEKDRMEKVQDDWTVWNGPDLWKAIAILLKWTTLDNFIPKPHIQTRGLNWYGVCETFGSEIIIAVLISL